MVTSIETLRHLRDQIRMGNPAVIGQFKEAIDPGLVLVMDRVLRTGLGWDALERWLSRALPDMPQTEGSDPSGTLARSPGMGLARGRSSAAESGVISSAETVL